MVTVEQGGETFTAANTAFVFIDHQEGIIASVADQPQERLRERVSSVAAAARVLDVPTVLTSASQDMIGPVIPELVKALGDQPTIERTVISAWADERVRAAVQATGRRKLVLSGVGTDVCLAHAALDAAADGYQVWAAIDISGTIDELSRQAAVQQMSQAGVGITTGPGAILRILADNASPKAGEVYAAMAGTGTPT